MAMTTVCQEASIRNLSREAQIHKEKTFQRPQKKYP